MQHDPPHVLVADRDRIQEPILTGELRALGYDVDVASTAYDVQRAIDARRYDVLLVDLALFGSSTVFFFRVIEERRPPVVVLLLSLATGITPDVARSSGFDACFAKVVDVRRLDQFLRARLPLSRRPLRHAEQAGG